jgi:hypothetical protein
MKAKRLTAKREWNCRSITHGASGLPSSQMSAVFPAERPEPARSVGRHKRGFILRAFGGRYRPPLPLLAQILCHRVSLL